MLSEPDDPVRQGYTFLGWYTASDLAETSRYNFSSPVNSSFTLYAKWQAVNPDNSPADDTLVANAYNELSIMQDIPVGTNSIVLPASMSNGVIVSWTTSSADVINTSTGAVNHQANHVSVILTATLRKGSSERTKQFNVYVRGTNPVTSSISTLNIQASNADNDNFRISYAEGSNRVSSIEGILTDQPVLDPGTAIEVLDRMSTMIGIRTSADNELEIASVTSDDSGYEYQFAQKAPDGTRYYGRAVTISVNPENIADSLSSNFSSVLPVNSADTRLTQEQAENVALNSYGTDADANIPDPDPDDPTERAEVIIYSFGEYEAAPVYAWIINVQGYDASGDYFDDEVIVHATEANTVIAKTTNLHGERVTGRGIDELGEEQIFPIDHDNDAYYMRDLQDKNLRIFKGDALSPIEMGTNGPWDDRQAVSVYVNAIEVLDWWKNTFNRNSVDGRGGAVRIVAHAPGLTDNASWYKNSNKIYIYDHDDSVTRYKYSRAVAIDTITHEMTHGVFESIIGVDFPYSGYTAAINDAYADLFGCFKTRSWKYGRAYMNPDSNYDCLRDIANPASTNAVNSISGEVKMSNANVLHNSDTHRMGYLVSHAAYLMNSYGMTWEDLEQLWYKSMSMGYNASSNFYSVRTCVMKAARKLGFTDEKVNMIRKAFDDEEIYDSRAMLYGNVSDYVEGSAIEGASIVIEGLNGNSYTLETDGDGYYSQMADLGTYTVKVRKDNYVEFISHVKLFEESEDVRVNAALVREGSGTVSGDIINATSSTAERIADVKLEVMKDWNASSDVIRTISTDANGRYTLAIEAGYYTIRKIKEGYITSTFNATVSPSGTRQQNSYLSPDDLNRIDEDSGASSGQRIVLSWGANPRDLDSHLVGRLSDGSRFHVYFPSDDKIGRNSSGTQVANLDHDDTQGNGYETVTFDEFDPDGEYDYFVHWYSGTGTWSGSNALVELYTGQGTRDTVSAPSNSEQANLSLNNIPLYWHVFSFRNGRFTKVDRLLYEGDYHSGELGAAFIADDNDAVQTILNTYYPPKTNASR